MILSYRCSICHMIELFFLILPSFLQRPPRNILPVLHALKVYTLHALVCLCNGFFQRRRRSRRGDDTATCGLERVV